MRGKALWRFQQQRHGLWPWPQQSRQAGHLCVLTNHTAIFSSTTKCAFPPFSLQLHDLLCLSFVLLLLVVMGTRDISLSCLLCPHHSTHPQNTITVINNMAVDTARLGSLQGVVGSVANWKAHASLKEAASSCKNEHSELPSPLFFSGKSWKMLAFYAISQLFNVYF